MIDTKLLPAKIVPVVVPPKVKPPAFTFNATAEDDVKLAGTLFASNVLTVNDTLPPELTLFVDNPTILAVVAVPGALTVYVSPVNEAKLFTLAGLDTVT